MSGREGARASVEGPLIELVCIESGTHGPHPTRCVVRRTALQFVHPGTCPQQQGVDRERLGNL